ncbi:MAG: hypothetical protein GTO61_13490 [Gemmatimonadales bacterium]|nr:hypothetical protein [Gemmatimonadales bacterium]
MSCNCNCNSSICACNSRCLAVLAIVLAGSLLYGVVAGMVEAVQNISFPRLIWIPLTILAMAGTVWGLLLGYRQHGRAEPLAVGIFGLAVALLGFLVSSPIALLGVTIVLGAALWSMLAHAGAGDEAGSGGT